MLSEFSTDIEADAEIKPWMRNLSEFIPKLQAIYQAKGRMARDLQMPPDWCKFGVFAIKPMKTKQIVLIHRATATEKVLPAKAQKMFVNSAAPYIEKSHSTKSATLCEQGSLASFPILTLFADDICCNDIPPDDAPPGASGCGSDDAPPGDGSENGGAEEQGEGGDGETGANGSTEQSLVSAEQSATELNFQPKPK